MPLFKQFYSNFLKKDAICLRFQLKVNDYIWLINLLGISYNNSQNMVLVIFKIKVNINIFISKLSYKKLEKTRIKKKNWSASLICNH